MAERPDPVADGHAALAAGDWQHARDLLETVTEPTPQVLDALGQARWWLGEPEVALQAWAEAFAGYRAAGEAVAGVRVAVRLSREYREGQGNEAAANGWYRRAARLLDALPVGRAHGWVALVEAEQAPLPADAVDCSTRALEIARAADDLDGELRALARLGAAEVAHGRVLSGMERLDEAMAAATSETTVDPETFGYVCCALTHACELAGDAVRMGQWSEVVERFLEMHPHVQLMAFCGSCGGELLFASGDWDEAERCVSEALAVLEVSRQTARCVHPVARLAELRVAQGRLEDAAAILAGYEGLPEAVGPAIALHCARGEYASADALLRRRIQQVDVSSLLAAPLVALQVDVALARDDVVAARQAAKQLLEIARTSGVARVDAEARLSHGRVAMAADEDGAADLIEQAVVLFGELGQSLHEARARLQLARALRRTNTEVAATEARTAFAAFERLGAASDADEASALIRELGPSGRAGPKGYGTLTRRETEVLRLVAHGLTNAEIAQRLFISPKTAGNHVSSILTKLGLRNRAEAAGHATRTLGG